MASSDLDFTDEEMKVDETVGFPRAFASLCRGGACGPYALGPPFAFVPYRLQDHEAARAREMDRIFPVIDPKAKQTAKPRIFVSLLWKQLNHLGNAGFDPAVIRVDPYGNVLYYHADSASPLSWEIDHWFPCSRGGLTVPSNLRILQWQACRKKHNKLEFLIPWWDFQLGVSVTQFLSIFASSDSDFRRRGFSFLFADGETEELNSAQTVESHSFPQPFVESKELFGLAPAAIVSTRREPYGSSILQSVDYNRIRSRSPIIAARKLRTFKENEDPDFLADPHRAIVVARDSLKQRESVAKMKEEAVRLDEEVSDMRRRNEEEKAAIQDLELALIKRRRRAEKCRRLAEAQSSYKAMIEKMIRDAMHQSVVYKEQVRLNQAATSALMARLEAQRAICDASEKDLHKKYKQRDELEKKIRPELDQGRKRSRMDDGTLVADEEEVIEVREQKAALCLPSTSRPRTPLHKKELRVYLEEQKEFETGHNMKLIEKSENFSIDKRGEGRGKAVIVVPEDEEPRREARGENELEEEKKIRFPMISRKEAEIKDYDEETRKERGKGNVEKWLQMLLENAGGHEDESFHHEARRKDDDDIVEKLNHKYPQVSRPAPEVAKSNANEDESFHHEARRKDDDDIVEKLNHKYPQVSRPAPEVVKSNANEERRHQSVGKERKVARSESSRGLRRVPSSPSIIIGMKKGVDCIIGKKPMVNGDDDEQEEHVIANSGFIKTIKKAIKL